MAILRHDAPDDGAVMEKHNHLTRDIKPRGECPACDRHWDRLDWEAK